MANIGFIATIGLLITLNYVNALHYKPRILSKYETILKPGENYTITCQGSKPLNWSTPTIESVINDPLIYGTSFTIEDVPPSADRPDFTSHLTITSMSYPYTGFYYCHFADADKNSEPNRDKVYIYVDDDEHLSVSNDELISTTVTQYEEAIIPCRPTAPSVNVTLVSDDNPRIKVDFATYNETIGFTFNATDINLPQFYKCIFKRDSTIVEKIIHLLIINFPINELATPALEILSESDRTIGKTVTLRCLVESLSHNVHFKWRTPSGSVDTTRMEVKTASRNDSFDNLISNDLVIRRTTWEDEGNFTCIPFDYQNHETSANILLELYDESEHFINLTEENHVYDIQSKAGQDSVQWIIDVKAHPTPTLTWFNNQNEEIPIGNNRKYHANVTATQAFLKIKHIDIKDFGNYTLIASNHFDEQKQLQLFLNVTDKPSVHIDSETFHLINTKCNVKCIVAAYPPPSIQWQYKPCQEDECDFEPLQEFSSERNGLQFVSYVQINATQSGYVKCLANNSQGSDSSTTGFYVSDVEKGFSIFEIADGIDYNATTEKAIIALGETLEMTCGVSNLNASNLVWYYNNRKIENDEHYTLENRRTSYSNRLILKVPNVQYADSGEYKCEMPNSLGQYIRISYAVSGLIPPFINGTKESDSIEMNLPDELKLSCMVYGSPKPTITWYKNEKIFNPDNNKQRIISKDKKTIIFRQTIPSDEGNYKCEASNKLGQASRTVSVTFKNIPKLYTYIIIIITLLLVVFFAGIFILYKILKERKLKNELRKMGLENFEKGNIENINPELGIDDQAELLPYDKKWEFPIEKLKLGIQLGSGAFGVVMKGEAKGILEGEESTTVAVKMVKRNADNTYIRALSSELKIMVHLGKHINVVNLLGACTKNVTKKELLVIVEYCRFGNIHNYLLRHRANFINQVDPKTGKIDFNIGQDLLERSYSICSSKSNNKSPSLKYATLAFSNSNGPPIISNSMGDYRSDTAEMTGTTARTEMTTVSSQNNSHGEDALVLSNNSIQPEWRSNYKGDYKDNKVKPMCTKDLLAWAFQVARGMEYLASRRVLHGDLAARNILLADNNVVKICDFGLAKSMYKSENYKKKSDGPLPIKWMAIESIRDRVFSTQSDVWSFGIVLWEFFSFAKTPYPGMEANEQLYHKLVDGYRMECPEYAPKQIYGFMNDCWRARPLVRPTFTKLVQNIGNLLDDSVKSYYIDLNNPYLVMNTQRIENSSQNDYLAMLSPPDFENLSSPHYLNESSGSQSNETGPDGYLCMKAANIFSPRLEDDEVFTFDANNRKRKDSDEAQAVELLPMLHTINEVDREISTSAPDCFSNPSYIIPNFNEPTDKNIVKSNDNYVNMPQNKTLLNKKNLSKNSLTDLPSDHQYVNNNARDWTSVIV